MAIVPVACTHRRGFNFKAVSLLFRQPMSLRTAENTLGANQSIERTNNGGRRYAASAASRAPLFAAHLQR
jgi:hypothetical protein